MSKPKSSVSTEFSSVASILNHFKKISKKENLEGMKRYGINVEKRFGVNLPPLREMAKSIGKNHELSLALWESGYKDAQLLAAMIGYPGIISKKELTAWVDSIDSWDVCDILCGNLVDKTQYAYELVKPWCASEKEFVRRCGFVLMCGLAVHDKKAGESAFDPFWPLTEKYATDERNFVKKAVNWALRQVGKRNFALNKKAIGAVRSFYC